MRCFLALFLFVIFINNSLQDNKINEDTDKFVNQFSESLNKLSIKIHEKFNQFKESVKNLFDREKRQNVDLLGVRNNIGFRSGLQSSANARVIDRISNVALDVSQKIVDQNLDNFDRLAGLQAPQEFCPFKQVGPCDPFNKFRTFDGSCNNLKNKWWGKSEIPYKRYLPSDYSDGIQSPRMFSVSGNQLPNPRLISRSICVDNLKSENFYTHMIAIFGQFLAHDITSVSTSTDDNGAVIDCPCGSPNPSCMSMIVPVGDQLIRSSCVRFTRSSAAFPTVDCRLGVREQLNIISSFIDGTQIYGMDESRNDQLRSRSGGQLKATPGVNGRPFMLKGADGACRDTNARVRCFIGGEGRANENLGLTSLQTLFLREHNRIATELFQINPFWDDETLFQETRRIVIATLQNIVYSEYLPAVIGLNTAAMFDLIPLNNGLYYNGYNETVNPTLANEFSAAAFRFGHTMVRNIFSRANQNNKKIGSVELEKILFRPVEAYNDKLGGIDSILLGLLNDPSSKYDTNFADALQNHLFEFTMPDGSVVAVDLAATNINRGRDHGLPSYNAYRERCGLKRAIRWEDLNDTINSIQIQQLASLYESPEDIDLYIGGLSETPSIGAAVGPVFGCLIASQFNDLKKGDRFYFENGPSQTAFSLEQLNQLRNRTFASVFCDNSDIEEIQPLVFFRPLKSIKNTRVLCSEIQKMDLRPWAERS